MKWLKKLFSKRNVKIDYCYNCGRIRETEACNCCSMRICIYCQLAGFTIEGKLGSYCQECYSATHVFFSWRGTTNWQNKIWQREGFTGARGWQRGTKAKKWTKVKKHSVI